LIYFWNFVWFVYALTTICRRVGDNYIYQTDIIPPFFYVMFIVNNIVVVAWLFLWDRQWLNWALLDIAFTPVTLYICLILSFRGVYNNIAKFEQNGATKDIWFSRIFIQNGMAFFATWVSIATLLNFAIVLTYYWGLDDMQISSSIALGILGFELIAWFLLDHLLLDKFVRYTLTPYIVVTLALGGSFAKNFDLDTNNRNSIMIACLLALAGVLLLAKLVLMFVWAGRNPIKGNVADDVKGTLA